MNTDKQLYQDITQQELKVKPFHSGVLVLITLIMTNTVIKYTYIQRLWILVGWTVVALFRWLSTLALVIFFININNFIH